MLGGERCREVLRMPAARRGAGAAAHGDEVTEDSPRPGVRKQRDGSAGQCALAVKRRDQPREIAPRENLGLVNPVTDGRPSGCRRLGV